MNKEDILKKVEALEEKERYIARCLNQNICPECGGAIHLSFKRSVLPGKRMVCKSCEAEYAVTNI